MRPAARREGLLVREIGGETIVYDAERHEAHYLNRTAALVFRHATGHRSIPELAALLVAAPSDPEDEATVRLALEQLAEARLMDGWDEGGEKGPSPGSAGRRQAILRVGLGVALLAPVVTSLLVPTPAEAAATCIPQSACTPAKYGQPCYVVSQAECNNKICVDTNLCQ